MFLAEWSGRRVAAYALTWLIGFPVLMVAVSMIGLSGRPIDRDRMLVPLDSLHSPAALRPVPGDSMQPDSMWRGSPVVPLRVVETRTVSASAVLLPAQDDDVAFGIAPIDAISLLPWLLPPALLVAAWAWSQRAPPPADD